MADKHFNHENLFLSVHSEHGTTITLYYAFHREVMQVWKEEEQANIVVRKIEPKSIQDKYNKQLEKIINDEELYGELQQKIQKIKKNRVLNCKKHTKLRKKLKQL